MDSFSLITIGLCAGCFALGFVARDIFKGLRSASRRDRANRMRKRGGANRPGKIRVVPAAQVARTLAADALETRAERLFGRSGDAPS